jgi:hypothetical protein
LLALEKISGLPHCNIAVQGQFGALLASLSSTPWGGIAANPLRDDFPFDYVRTGPVAG